MPQLVKGGKYTFGWTRVGPAGQIAVPPEASKEYHLEESTRLVLVPGSRTSGGFSLGALASLAGSPLGAALIAHPALREFQAPEGAVVEHNGKPYCWVELRGGEIVVPPETLERYGIKVGDDLLVIRGSGLAVGFAARGPIVREAHKHPELMVFAPQAGISPSTRGEPK